MKPAEVPLRKLWDKKAQKLLKNQSDEHMGGHWEKDSFLRLAKRYISIDKVVLEIGCGTGRLVELVSPLAKHVIGVDYSEPMIEKAKLLVRLLNVEFRVNDGMTLEGFEDDSIDIVFVHNTFVNFPFVLVYWYLEEIERVLRPTGVGIATFKNLLTQDIAEDNRRMREARKLSEFRDRYVTEEMIRHVIDKLGMGVLEIRDEQFLTVVFGKEDAIVLDRLKGLGYLK